MVTFTWGLSACAKKPSETTAAGTQSASSSGGSKGMAICEGMAPGADSAASITSGALGAAAVVQMAAQSELPRLHLLRLDHKDKNYT